MKKTIHDHTFELSAPYTSGHIISEVEAKVLNQTRAENIGNNMRASLKDAVEQGAPESKLQEMVAEYDAKYNFSMGGERVVLDPLERECRLVARQAVKEWLASPEGGGRKLKDVDPDQLENTIDQVSTQDDVIAEAKKRLKAKQKKVQINLGGLLGAPAQA